MVLTLLKLIHTAVTVAASASLLSSSSPPARSPHPLPTAADYDKEVVGDMVKECLEVHVACLRVCIENFLLFDLVL